MARPRLRSRGRAAPRCRLTRDLQGPSISEILTTASLEKRTGVPRTTIGFYAAQGLLPKPHKTSSGRSLYNEQHVALLARIGDLKGQGLSLSEIKAALQGEIDRAGNSEVDLASQEHARVRAEILRVATQEFAEKGFRRTHVATIISKLGINPYIFYRHFPNKLQLLVECFDTFIRWNAAATERAAAESRDLGERLLKRVASGARVAELATDLAAVMRMEGGSAGCDPYRLSEVWTAVIRRVVDDLGSAERAGSPPSPVPFELIAFSLIGADRDVKTRLTWDDKYSDADRLRTHLFIYLAIVAAVHGDADVYSMLPRYEGLIQELVDQNPGPPLPVEE